MPNQHTLRCMTHKNRRHDYTHLSILTIGDMSLKVNVSSASVSEKTTKKNDSAPVTLKMSSKGKRKIQGDKRNKSIEIWTR